MMYLPKKMLSAHGSAFKVCFLEVKKLDLSNFLLIIQISPKKTE